MAHVAKVTFTRGEVTPLVHARVDVELYKAAAKSLLNWYCLKEGGIRRRSGTKYIGKTKSATLDTRLVDFVFSSSQAYALEMGNLYTRFWTAGAQVLDGDDPYEIVSPYATANLRSIQWAQSFDVMYFAHKSTSIPTKKLLRNGNADWAWADVDFVDGPYLPINDKENPATFSDFPYPGTTITFAHDSTDNINDGDGFASTDVGRHYRIELAGAWAWGTISAVNSTTEIEVDIVDGGFTVNSGTGTWRRKAGFTDPPTNGATMAMQLQSGTHTLTTSDVGKIGQFTIDDASYAGTYLCTINSLDTNNTANLTFLQGRSTTFDEGSFGYVANTSKSWRLGAFSETTGWPKAISWFQGRLFFANTEANPNALWYSKTGLPESFGPSDFDGTVTDANGGMVSLLGRADEILWLHEAPRLQIGTAGAIRSLGGTDSNDAFGPRNVSQRYEVGGGAEDVLPVSVGPSTVHTSKYGKEINDLYFDFNVNSLVAPNLSVTSEHLFDSRIKELWFQQHPNNLLWAILDNGELVATTLERYEKVTGFSRQPIEDAEVLSACSIPGAVQDDMYFVTRRTINQQQVQLVEILQPRFLRNDQEDAWFVDCGGQYMGAASNTVSGITWLRNETVDALGDGAVYPELVVSGAGVLTLPNGATAETITFGLRITNEFGTLPPPVDAPDGSSKGRKMRVVEVVADVYETSGLKFTSNMGQEDSLVFRLPSTPMGTPDPLLTGKRKLKIDGSWLSEGMFTGTITYPLPGTIRALNIGLDYEP